MRYARAAFLLLIATFGYRLLFAQATTSLRGRVADASGAVISGASCTLTLMATGSTRQGTTNNAGEYEFSQLAPGEYSLKVSRQGFSPVEKRGMNLLVGQPATEDVT